MVHPPAMARAFKPSSEALDVLQRVTTTGTTVTITSGQLARPLYAEVDKVLKALGGKWDRRAGGHVFTADPSDALDEVIATGVLASAKTPNQRAGFFPTPGWLAVDLADRLKITSKDFVLEPSAGLGALVKEILARGASCLAVEYDEARARTIRDVPRGDDGDLWIHTGDFMEVTQEFILAGEDQLPNVALMNPPFLKVGLGDHIDHVRHAFELLSPDGRLGAVMPASVKFRQDKRHAAFRAWIYSHDGDIDDVPEGTFKESGTDVRTVFVTVSRA